MWRISRTPWKRPRNRNLKVRKCDGLGECFYYGWQDKILRTGHLFYDRMQEVWGENAGVVSNRLQVEIFTRNRRWSPLLSGKRRWVCWGASQVSGNFERRVMIIEDKFVNYVRVWIITIVLIRMVNSMTWLHWHHKVIRHTNNSWCFFVVEMKTSLFLHKALFAVETHRPTFTYNWSINDLLFLVIASELIF